MAGTPIASELSRGQSGQGPFPLASQNNIKIGYVIVPDFASLATIETWRRFYGMIADVIGDQRYRLEIDLTTWTPLGSGTLPDDVLTEDEILDGEGYIKASLIRNLFINDSFVVASEAAMLALTTVTGNAIIRTDTGAVFIKLNNDDPASLDDFADITANTGAVTTVNGQTGAVQITIANLLAVAQNVTDFQAAVSTSPAVTTQGSAISTLQSQVAALISAVDSLEGTGTRAIYKYDPLASYIIENYVIGTSGTGALELFEVISNTTPGKSPYGVDAATFYKKVGDYYSKSETDDLLGNKADRVDGKVPLSQIPTSELGLKVFANISTRDAFPSKYTGMRVLVVDATADPNIPDSPVVSAEYVYDPLNPLADVSGFIFINTSVSGGTAATTSFESSGNISSSNVQDAIEELDSEKQSVSQKGVANGYASLDSSGLVPSNQLPSYVDDVLEFANLATFPVTGETGKIYLALDSNFTYRWSGSAYILLTSQPADGSETIKGVFEKATAAEINSNTAIGGTGAGLAVTPDRLSESKYLDQSGGKLSATASGTNTYTATITPAITAYAATQRFFIRFTNANNAASTLSLNGLAAINIQLEGRALLAGDIKAGQNYLLAYDGTNFQIIGAGKLNRGSNSEYENLGDSSDDYGIAFLSRLGAVFKSSSVRWNESLKQLRVLGTQAIWSAVAGVTDGNMGIKVLETAVEAFKIFDNTGNFFSVGTESGLRSTRILTALQLRNGIARNETEFKAVSVAASATQLLKTISVPNDTILTVDIYNIAVMNQDEDYMFGFSQMSFYNNGGAVSEISRDELKYGRVWSSIKGTDGYLISTDTRFSASISGTDVSINFVNTEAKLVSVNCELKYTIVNKPS